MTKDIKSLSGSQLNVMKVLWKIQQGSVSEVLNELGGNSYARTTVATMLSRLEKQGFVEMRKVHGVNTYLARKRQNDIKRASVSSVLSNLFAGNKTELVSHLLHEDVTQDELDSVIRLLNEKKKSLGDNT